MKRRSIPLILLLLPLCFLFFGFAPAKSALDVTVTDALSGATLFSARVTVVETGSAALTDRGSAVLETPYSPDPRLPEPPPFGTCTLVVTCGGYVPMLATGCVVYPRATRKITISLFRDDGSVADGITTLVESPPTDWAKSVVGKIASPL